ncbi:MAG: cysteine desulfurase family protein, partial [Bacteroidota bacterium]
MSRIYLDNAATTPIDPSVVDYISNSMKTLWGNPSSIYQEGRTSRAALEEARKTIANGINASIGEIFFTSGGTESNNMALKCAVRDLGVTRIISSSTEHHAVLHTLDSLAKYQSTKIEMVEHDECGKINMESLEQLLKASEDKTLVSLMYANNEIGTLLDLPGVSALCEEYGAFLHSDSVQGLGFYPIDVETTKIHFLSGSGHKFYGPKGVGFIYINNEAMLKPFIDGGAQERNMRGGTENLYGILGMAKAFSIAIEEMDTRREIVESVRNY